jgi:tetratricopeptide (TPR) repeat protein
MSSTIAECCVDFGVYRIAFSLEGVPRTSHFVGRPAQMEKIEHALLPRHRQNGRQKIYVLRGLGGIGKTQLAVEFARQHHRQFSAVFWLDGRSEDSLKRSIASCASKIPQGQIAETSRTYAADGSVDPDAVVRDVLGWLARPDNTAWLLIFDNVDREYSQNSSDADAYDVKRYLSGADHGSVLITTRLARLEQLGESQELGKVDEAQAKTIFESWCKQAYGEYTASMEMVACSANTKCVDAALGEQLLRRLDGLPLAIAQAGAYLQESGASVETYLRFYDQQWDELMVKNEDDVPLQDYPDRSVWTTWAISYQAIYEKHKFAAHLLLLWSFLDNKDLWHGLFAVACASSSIAQSMLLEWIGDAATSELAFSRAMLLLRSYSLAEAVEGLACYTTHPVVHRWAYYSKGKRFATVLGPLAVVVVGWAVPHSSLRDFAAVQRRLLPHAQAGSLWLAQGHNQKEGYSSGNGKEMDAKEHRERQAVLGATNLLGRLYADQGKLSEAEKMYERALRGSEEALGPDHTSTLNIVNNLGLLYTNQGKLAEAEQMYERALRGSEEALGPNHTSTLDTVNNLGLLYADQGKLAEAEQMYKRALQGSEEALGPNYTATLHTVHNLGNLYRDQGKLSEAEKMYERALRGSEEALGLNHTSTLSTVNSLGNLYIDQGKLAEAEQMYERALRGKEEALGPNHTSTLNTVNNLGNLYRDQGKLAEAEKMYERALQGREEALGSNHTSTLSTVNNLGLLYADQGKLAEAEQMHERALQGYKKALGDGPALSYLPALNTFENLGNLYEKQEKPAEARAMYSTALFNLKHVLSPSSDRCVQLASRIHALEAPQARIGGRQQSANRQEPSCSSHEGNEQKLTLRQRVRSMFRH